MPTNHELTAHVADKETLLINFMTLSNEKSGETVRQNAPSSNRRCFAAQGQLETRSQSTPSHRHHPAPRAIKTQPLSNCVVRVCAYQSARQRNIGIAKKLAKAFDN